MPARSNTCAICDFSASGKPKAPRPEIVRFQSPCMQAWAHSFFHLLSPHTCVQYASMQQNEQKQRIAQSHGQYISTQHNVFTWPTSHALDDGYGDPGNIYLGRTIEVMGAKATILKIAVIVGSRGERAELRSEHTTKTITGLTVTGAPTRKNQQSFRASTSSCSRGGLRHPGRDR